MTWYVEAALTAILHKLICMPGLSRMKYYFSDGLIGKENRKSRDPGQTTQPDYTLGIECGLIVAKKTLGSSRQLPNNDPGIQW